MIIHPGSKTFSRYIDQELPAAQAKKLTGHLEKCQRCRARLQMLQAMEPALTTKTQLSCDFRQNFVSALKEVKRIKQPSCAEIKAILGQVMIYRNGDDEGIEGFTGMALKKGDTLKPIGNSLALIELNDGSNLYLNKETEIEFPSGNYPLSLLAGELFAMMKPQRQLFEIKTPSAVLGVIGTDFDAQITKKNATILKVLKGKVSFQNDAGKTVVKKRRQVEAAKHIRPTTTRLKETRSIMSWTKPVRPEKVRGGAGIRNLGLLMLLLALILAGVWYFGKQQEPAAPEVVKLEKTDPLELPSPYRQQGMSWLTRTENQLYRKGNWIDDYHMVTRTEVLEVDEQNGSHVLLTIEECGVPEGHPDKEVARRMIGRRFDYQITPEGRVHSPGTYDGKPLEYMEISFFARTFGRTETSWLFARQSVVPGEQWPDQLEVKIPGYPNSYVKFQGMYQFVGYELRDGVEVAVIRGQYRGVIGGGIPLNRVVEPRATREVFVDYIELEGARECVVDPTSGRVVSVEETHREGNAKITVVSMIQGRRVPVQETLEPKETTVSRAYMSVEYPE